MQNVQDVNLELSFINFISETEQVVHVKQPLQTAQVRKINGTKM